MAILRPRGVSPAPRIAYHALEFGGRLKSSPNVVTVGASGTMSATQNNNHNNGNSYNEEKTGPGSECGSRQAAGKK
jgi:hypothetical protein